MKPDLVAGALGLGVGVLVLVASASISPPRYEPLGAGAVPVGAAIGLLVSSLALIAGAVARNRRGAKAAAAAGWTLVPHPRPMLTMLAAIALYILLFNSPVVGFRGATVLFVVAGGLALGVRSRRALLWLLASAILVAFGCHYLFTRIFVVDLT